MLFEPTWIMWCPHEQQELIAQGSGWVSITSPQCPGSKQQPSHSSSWSSRWMSLFPQPQMTISYWILFVKWTLDADSLGSDMSSIMPCSSSPLPWFLYLFCNYSSVVRGKAFLLLAEVTSLQPVSSWEPSSTAPLTASSRYSFFFELFWESCLYEHPDILL